MLTEKVITFMNTCSYNPDAERRESIIPFGGIYWNDEIPDFREISKMEKTDQICLFNLFRIRYSIWDGKQITGDDLEFWNIAQQQVPGYPLFRRLTLSEEDRMGQLSAENDFTEMIDTMVDSGYEVHFKNEEVGFSINASKDLTRPDDE